jgi:D-3-phosphoglycerate dehydrogenase
MNSRAKLDIIGVELFPETALDILKRRFDVSFFPNADEIQNRISTHVWIDLKFIVDTGFLKKFPKLTHLVCRATTTSNINEKVMELSEIKVVSLRNHLNILEQIPSTAELAWLLLQISNVSLRQIQNQIRVGMWDRSTLIRSELSRKKLGIIGFGRLGKIVSRYAKAFDLDIYVAELSAKQMDQKVTRATIREICQTCDWIVITASVNPNPTPILSAEILDTCHENTKIINVSRGRLVDETHLIEKLVRNEIAFYASDSCKFEDFDATQKDYENFLKFTKMENVFLTPHIGGYTKEAIAKTTSHLAQYLVEGSCNCSL